MRIFTEELKKIWRPFTLLILVAFCMLYFLMFCNRYCNYPHIGFGNDTINLNSWPGFLVTSQLLEEYGPRLEPEERLDAEKYEEENYRKLDPFVQGKAAFEEEGIFSGRDLWDFHQGQGKFAAAYRAAMQGEHTMDAWHAKQEKLVSPLVFGDPYAPDGGPALVDSGYAMWKLQSIQSLFESWDLYQSGEIQRYAASSENQGIVERVGYMEESEEYQNIFFKDITDLTGEYYAYAAVLLLISNFILLIPYLVKDRVSGVISLQCSGRVGRKILKTQFFSAIGSSLLLAVSQLALLTFLFFCRNDFSAFLHLKVSSAYEFIWFDLTYLQWLCLLLSLLLVLTLAAGTLFFAASHLSREYIPALAKSLPVLGGLCLVAYQIPSRFLYVGNALYQFLQLWVEGVELYWPAAVFLLAGGLAVLFYKRWKRTDL